MCARKTIDLRTEYKTETMRRFERYWDDNVLESIVVFITLVRIHLL